MAPLVLLISSFFIATLIYIFLNLRTRLLNRHHPPLPPGPKPWPIIGNLPHLGLPPHQNLAAMVPTYGPLIYLRLGSVHVVVACSASVAAQFLKTHDANFASRPPNSGAKHIAYNYKDLVFAPYGHRWRMFRKICAVHLFSVKALDEFRYIREEEVAVMTKALALSNNTSTNSPVNLAGLLNVCTTNALGRVLLGRRLCGDGEGHADLKSQQFKEMVVELMVLSGVFNISDFIPSLEWLDLQGVAAKMKKLHKRFDAFLTTIIEEHKMKGSDYGSGTHQQQDFLSKLFGLKEDVDGEELKLTDTEIKALLLNLFTAGTDTSSSTVEWALAELIRHPKILAQAQQELDSVVGKDRLVSESDLSQLTFLQAIVKETFRLHPSTPLSLPRIADEDCEINGYFIPKKSTLIVNVWAIARDPSIWSDPLRFQPERFLPGSEKAHIDVKGSDFEIIPFGAGRRICAGLSLGLRMVQFMTATLVHAFNWDLPEGQLAEKLNMEEAYGLTLQRASPLMVHPKPRLAAHVYGTTKT
ncbi:Cytochrome P450 [Macleaya cordata]|uniref:Cytochrome P450 n=1 Tax=Macleaya cordata TaxID=56857 RepID=A0A200PRG2_MACCD|nr:Cytochrome P450 [Macleaya cordata]